jgi:hypothetical protein
MIGRSVLAGPSPTTLTRWLRPAGFFIFVQFCGNPFGYSSQWTSVACILGSWTDDGTNTTKHSSLPSENSRRREVMSDGPTVVDSGGGGTAVAVILGIIAVVALSSQE